MSLLNAFNTQLINLLNNLCEMYPNDNDIHFSSTTIRFLKKSNPRQLYTICDKYISMYSKEIMEKDDLFFLENNYSKHYNNKPTDDINHIERIIDNLKKYWETMDSDSRENIWKYMQVLQVLNNKIKNQN